MGLEGFDRVFLDGFRFGKSLIVIEVDQVGGPVVLTSLSAFGAVSSEVSYFSALEAGVRLVSRGSRVALEVILRAIPLIAIGVLSSAEVIASIISSVVSLSRRSVPIDVHRDRGIVHPSRSVG